jgi:8-oxo-dGTP pyrophosphatase MutT (NUDIX family)
MEETNISKAHRELVSAGVLLECEGKYLIACPWHGVGTTGGWGVPKGKQDQGETLIQTALREFYEETGLKLSEKDLTTKEPIYSYRAKGKDDTGKFHKTVHIFHSKSTNPELLDFKFECLTFVKGNKPEIADYKWVKPGKAKDLVIKKQKELFEKL